MSLSARDMQVPQIYKEKKMNKILVTLLVVLFVFATFPSGNVYASNFECDSICIQKAINGELSPSEIEYLGVGNVVKAITNYYKGDVWKALKILGLAPNTYIANTTANSVYGTQLDGAVYGMFVCQSDYVYCEEGQVLGYKQRETNIIRIICNTGEVCKEEVLLENQPSNLLNEVFNQSRYYGGPGAWK